MRTGWSSLKNKLFITLFEQKRQHLWYSCWQISWVILNRWHFIVSLVNGFGEFDDSPFKEIGAALACLRGISKMAAEWHDLSSHFSSHFTFSGRFYPKRLTVQIIMVFYPYVCSLGIEPTTFCAANAMLYHWATQTHRNISLLKRLITTEVLYRK